MEIGGQSVGLAGSKPRLVYQAIQGAPPPAGLLRVSSLDVAGGRSDVPLEHVHFAAGKPHPFWQQESIQDATGGNLIGSGPDVPMEHAHQDKEVGGLGVESAGSEAGAGLPGNPRFSPPRGNLLPRSGSLFSLEYDRNLPDVPLEHVRF